MPAQGREKRGEEIAMVVVVVEEVLGQRRMPRARMKESGILSTAVACVVCVVRRAGRSLSGCWVQDGGSWVDVVDEWMRACGLEARRALLMDGWMDGLRGGLFFCACAMLLACGLSYREVVRNS
ncbi:hypothetical protein IWX49DRAFT_134311 [Phyllosticta citricarpa]